MFCKWLRREFISEPWQIQMWIFVITWSWKSMFDYLIKNKSVELPFGVLKVCSGLSRESLDILAVLNLYAFMCPYFIHFCYWLQLQNSIARFTFSGKCLRLSIFLSVPRGRSLSVEPILISNFETCKPSIILLILDKFPSLNYTSPSLVVE